MEIGDTQKFDTSIDGYLAEGGDLATIFSKIIGQELSHGSSADIYSRCQMDFTSNAVGTKGKTFVHLGIPAVSALDELNPFGTPLAESEGRRMGTIGLCRVIFLENLQRLE